MSVIGQDIETAASLLKKGIAVAIPTETVYGLAVNAFDPIAVTSVFTIKNRPDFDPLIVHVGNHEAIRSFTRSVHPVEELLMRKYWPGPMTIILQRNDRIPDIVCSGLDTVGVRMPNHEVTLKLLNLLPFPLAAPSANPFGYISPTRPDHVDRQLGDQIPYILDGGDCSVGVESTILKVENDKVHVLRLGGLSVDRLKEDGFDPVVSDHSSSRPSAPGMLTSHYSPWKKIMPLKDGETPDETTSVLYFSRKPIRKIDRTLSESGDLEEAARNLFRLMRELEQENSTGILVEFVPEVSLGRAINDRLRRACAMG